MAKLLPEFPTEWHQEAYLAALEREQEGYRVRLGDLEAAGLKEGDRVWDETKSGLEAATAEHDRVSGKKPAAKKAAAQK